MNAAAGRTFTLHLQGATQYECFDNAVFFRGEDSSGSFGLLAGHERFITVLDFGLAAFRTVDAGGVVREHFLAQPGGVLRFVDNTLTFSTRRYLRDSDSGRLHSALEQELRAEEEALAVVKEHLHQLEDGMLRRLWELSKSGVRYGG